MRKDFKDVIVDTGRYKYGEKKKNSLIGFHEEQIEDLPERQAMRRNHTGWGFEFGDRTRPLEKFLKKHIGRPWNDVWSEICQQNDNRTIRGYHLREHVKNYVEGAGGQEYLGRWYRRWGFYVDDDGLLQYAERRYDRTPNYDPNVCTINDNRYERINGCWFAVWYEKVRRGYQYFSYALNRKDVAYYYEDVKTCQKQLSRRELKKLGLSNDPDFKWWER